MKIRISKAMEREIEVIKDYSLWLSRAKIKDIKKIEKQATKHKRLMALFKVPGSPIFLLYVNNKFYSSYIFDGHKWVVK